MAIDVPIRLTAWATLLGFVAATPVDEASAAGAAPLRDAARSSTMAAVRIAENDRAAAALDLDDAADAAELARDGARGRGLRRVDELAARIDAARTRVADAASDDESVVRAIRRAVRSAHSARRAIASADDGVELSETRRGAGFHRAGARVTFRVARCDEAPAVTVTSASADAALRTFEPGVETLADGAFRVTLGPDLGGVRVSATACGATREWIVFAEGPRGALRSKPPAAPDYGRAGVSWRAGAAVPALAPAAQGATERFEVTPALPPGVSIDAASGAISGTPTAASPTADHVVLARNLRGVARTALAIQVTPALPAEVAELEEGFAIEPVLAAADVPVKMAFAPDGRLFFNELITGNVRVLRADGSLVAEPFATLAVLTGGERGLLGLALAPDFASSGHLFVYVTSPAENALPDRGRIVRFTADGDSGTDATVVVDSLPVAIAQNGGALAFGPDGKLYATVGDTADPDLAQTDGSRAGRILRFEPDGSPAAGNPVAGDPEWCRGLRNAFDLTFHPVTGGLFASENGPTAHDELEFVQPGKNFEWGAPDEAVPGPQVGLRMVDWTPVIVPTGITFLARGGFGATFASSLFVAGYDLADVRRLALSGAQFTDVDEELPFAGFVDEGVANKPLDLAEAPDGSLYVSTFTAIWRIYRY